MLIFLFYMKNKIDETFVKSLVVIASGISRNADPYELVNGAIEYLMKNWQKYETHENLKAIAILKMKGLHIDTIRKNKFTDNINTDDDGKAQEFESDEISIVDQLQIKSEFKQVLNIIRSMGEKCREILMLAAEGMSYQEMLQATQVSSLGTVMSRLSNCRKELKERLSHD